MLTDRPLIVPIKYRKTVLDEIDKRRKKFLKEKKDEKNKITYLDTVAWVACLRSVTSNIIFTLRGMDNRSPFGSVNSMFTSSTLTGKSILIRKFLLVRKWNRQNEARRIIRLSALNIGIFYY